MLSRMNETKYVTDLRELVDGIGESYPGVQLKVDGLAADHPMQRAFLTVIDQRVKGHRYQIQVLETDLTDAEIRRFVEFVLKESAKLNSSQVPVPGTISRPARY